MSEQSPISLYFHIPYCAKRCGYCDFNTYTPAELRGADANSLTISSRNEIEEVAAGFSQYLIKEFDLLRNKYEIQKPLIHSIFIGGGTPTLLSSEQYKILFSHLNAHAIFTHDIEITIEANPDTVNLEYLKELREIGINRVSFGMQSSVPRVLKTLDRTHNPANVSKAVNDSRAAGFDEINVDLIYGTPGEGIEDWKESVSTALSLPITHISAYALIVEDGTKLSRAIEKGEINEPDDDLSAEKYIYADNEFHKHGFHWYELSNWAKPGSHSRHNNAYWNSTPWWGIGPGAHSFMNDRRWWNEKYPAKYQNLLNQNQLPELGHEILTSEIKNREEIMLKIRLREGLPIQLLAANGHDYLENQIDPALLEQSELPGGKIVLTQKGRLLADAIIRELCD